MSPLVSEFIGAIIRWALTVFLTWLATHGVLTSEQVERMANPFTAHLLAGAAVALPLAWSLRAKWVGRLKLLAAQLLPAHATEDDIKVLAKEPEIKARAFQS